MGELTRRPGAATLQPESADRNFAWAVPSGCGKEMRMLVLVMMANSDSHGCYERLRR